MLKIIAIFFTIGLHLLLFFISIPQRFMTKDVAVNHVPILLPVTLVSEQKQPLLLLADSESPKQVKVKEKKKIKPTQLPGDRKFATISKKVRPVYPKKALNYDWKGKIVVQATINPKGKVSHIKILKSTGYTILDQSFVRTVMQYYVFKPKRVMGKNVSSFLKLSYDFDL
ncbi:MAG: energy transducer TonB [bacterium]